MDFAEGLGRRAVSDRPCLLKEKSHTLYWKETENRDLKKPGRTDEGRGKCGVKGKEKQGEERAENGRPEEQNRKKAGRSPER